MRSTRPLLVVAALAVLQGGSLLAQAPGAGRGAAGLGVPADAPPVRAVAPGPHAVTVESYATLPMHTAYHPTWLDYQLKGSAEAAKWFVGPDCRLCTERVWSIQKKGMR